jgi:hypothetical protein
LIAQGCNNLAKFHRFFGSPFWDTPVISGYSYATARKF